MDKFDYDFMAINATDYTLIVEMEIKGLILSSAFERAKEKFKEKMQNNINIDKIDNFEVDQRLLNVLSTNSGPIIRAVRKQIAGDGIKILSRWVESAKFVKDKENWKVKITFNGIYSK